MSVIFFFFDFCLVLFFLSFFWKYLREFLLMPIHLEKTKECTKLFYQVKPESPTLLFCVSFLIDWLIWFDFCLKFSPHRICSLAKYFWFCQHPNSILFIIFDGTIRIIYMIWKYKKYWKLALVNLAGSLKKLGGINFFAKWNVNCHWEAKIYFS